MDGGALIKRLTRIIKIPLILALLLHYLGNRTTRFFISSGLNAGLPIRFYDVLCDKLSQGAVAGSRTADTRYPLPQPRRPLLLQLVLIVHLRYIIIFNTGLLLRKTNINVLLILITVEIYDVILNGVIFLQHLVHIRLLQLLLLFILPIDLVHINLDHLPLL